MNAVQILKSLEGKTVAKVVINNFDSINEQCVKSVVIICSDNTQIVITDYHEEYAYHDDILVRREAR